MLRVTKAEEQALRLVMRLAAVGKQQTLSELAEAEMLPEPMVAKLLGQLRRGRVVQALRGRHGGYVLATPPAQISVAAVVRALGTEPAPPQHCLQDATTTPDCPRLDDCGLRSVWRHLQVQVTDLLERTSLADLLRAEHSVAAHLNRIWPAEPAPTSFAAKAAPEGRFRRRS